MSDVEKIILLCLPFAGAGPSFYRPWSVLAGDELEILPLTLPGRERLIDDEPFRDVPKATEYLLKQATTKLRAGAKVSLFGHSLGAVLAYELAHRFTEAPGIEILRLFVSGSPEPGNPRANRATGLSDDEFLARVTEFAGYSHSALEDPEMRSMILPTLRADVEMHENYRPSTELPLAAPITVVRGEDDRLVGYEDAAAWAKVAGRDFEHIELPGGHMYLTESAPALVRLIRSTVL